MRERHPRGPRNRMSDRGPAPRCSRRSQQQDGPRRSAREGRRRWWTPRM